MKQQPENSRRFVSYAQNREDVVLWRALQHVTPGRYVDVGAADPIDDSVTYALYERGWRGVHIEPVPVFAAALRTARPDEIVVECGIGAVAGMATFSVVDDTGLSSFDAEAADTARHRGHEVREIQVPVRTLGDVLGEHLSDGETIHFVKIDVEGFEQAVLEGADLDRWRPWVLVIEATAPGSTRPTHAAWEPLVHQAGYEFSLFDGLNRFYLHRDHLDLGPALSYPACVHDGAFYSPRDIHNERRIAENWSEVERREEFIDEMRSDHRELLAAHRAVSETHEHLGSAHRTVLGELEHLASRHRTLVDDLKHLGSTNDSLVDDVEQLGSANKSLVDDVERLETTYRTTAEELEVLQRDYRMANQNKAMLQAAYDRALTSISWRVTAPLRAVRGLGRSAPVSDPGITSSVEAAAEQQTQTPPQTPRLPRPTRTDGDGAKELDGAFRRRLRSGAAVLDGAVASASNTDPVAHFAQSLARTEVESMTVAWLSFVVATATYPDEPTLRAEDRVFRRLGPRGYADHVVSLFDGTVRNGQARPLDLDVVENSVVVDVTHTAQHDLQTGIQRVVRETCSRWLRHEQAVLVWWDYGAHGLRRLGADDVDRFEAWRHHLALTESGSEPLIHSLDEGAPDAIVVPWRSRVILPELAAEPERTEGYRTLACSGLIDRLSAIGYDIIPVTAAETVTEGMSQRFSLYLSMLKRSQRVAAISVASANDFRGFNSTLSSQGLTGPVVEAHPLPPSPEPVDDAVLASIHEQFGVEGLPLVLVVGSHEPRKNHLTVLEAAESLWSSDVDFVLLFIGGSGWRSESFDREVENLQAAGRRVSVRRGASESELWAAYRLARFTVFPSLVEGYGLPIVESIASGTPVITTNYGSMAEVAEGGGGILIDPYDAGSMAIEMRRLLLDDDELARLEQETAARVFPSWDEYADAVWRFLAEDDG
ncbi:MAG: FkbM family methyltransferase [Ilumatobacteraceae bacterium]